MNEVEELLITAHFKKESKKGYKPPGKKRIRTHLMGISYVHTDHGTRAPAWCVAGTVRDGQPVDCEQRTSDNFSI